MLEKFEELKGVILKNIEVKKDEDDDRIYFELENNDIYQLFHRQECCESVTIDEIIGDINDLIGSPILLAEEVINGNKTPEGVKPDYLHSYTWTFYKLSTIKGSVTIHWFGNSNGYYSESVDWEKAN